MIQGKIDLSNEACGAGLDECGEDKRVLHERQQRGAVGTAEDGGPTDGGEGGPGGEG